MFKNLALEAATPVVQKEHLKRAYSKPEFSVKRLKTQETRPLADDSYSYGKLLSSLPQAEHERPHNTVFHHVTLK